MPDLTVDEAAGAAFASAIGAHAAALGADCMDTGGALGSGVVRDALGNKSLVLTLLDRAMAAGAGALAHDARAAEGSWTSVDPSVAAKAVGWRP